MFFRIISFTTQKHNMSVLDSLLCRWAVKCPKNFGDLFYFTEDLPASLSSNPDFRYDLPFHTLASKTPLFFLKILNTYPHSVSELGHFKNRFHETPFHILASTEPLGFINFLKSNPDKILSIASFRDSVGNSVFHSLASIEPHLFFSFISSIPKVFLLCSHLINNAHQSPLHFINFNF